MPGEAFFEDYQRFYKAQFQLQSPTIRLLPTAPQPSALPETELAAYFYEKKYGAPAAGAAEMLAAGDIDFARLILGKHPIIECRSFIDFALSEARATNFDVRTFRGLGQYHAAFLAKREEQSRKRITDDLRRKHEEAERQEHALVAEYDSFKRAAIEQIRSSLDLTVLSELEEALRIKMRQGPVRFKEAEGRLLRIAVNDQLASEHDVPSFEEWKAARSHGIEL